MSSRIEQIIEEIEEYIESCKFQPFICNKNYCQQRRDQKNCLRELRLKTPDEIKTLSEDHQQQRRNP